MDRSAAMTDDATSTRESCTCTSCVGACHRKPGWMKPGEAEKIAEFLSISLEQLFRESLAVDWWEAATNVYLLSPAVIGGTPGAEFPYDPTGTCVFLKDGRCSIHPVKPFECRVAWCGDGPVDVEGSAHQQARDSWNAAEHQAQIVTLLGREPEPSSAGSIWDMLSLIR